MLWKCHQEPVGVSQRQDEASERTGRRKAEGRVGIRAFKEERPRLGEQGGEMMQRPKIWGHLLRRVLGVEVQEGPCPVRSLTFLEIL